MKNVKNEYLKAIHKQRPVNRANQQKTRTALVKNNFKDTTKPKVVDQRVKHVTIKKNLYWQIYTTAYIIQTKPGGANPIIRIVRATEKGLTLYITRNGLNSSKVSSSMKDDSDLFVTLFN